MKFCRKYEEYMQGQDDKSLPRVGFKKLKKILKKCKADPPQSRSLHHHELSRTHPHGCQVCDEAFFPSLREEMSAVVGCFNERAQKLLELHLASGFRKFFIWFTGMIQGIHVGSIQEGKDLVTYAIINAIAMRKILKKYDKIHVSNQGQIFKLQAQKLHIEILQSPWLCELMAFHINLRNVEAQKRKASASFEDCSLLINDGKPFLSYQLFDSIKLDIELTCSICLDIVFDPVALTCGHIFCYMCACKAASVTIVDGLEAADRKEKCPLCRQAGVYEGAVHLEELNILLSQSCHEYWEERLRTERLERIKQTREHWESHCQVMGL
ncbi:hypothetical protein NMG60_11035005 [Bertholletia excelsa]